jgi:hypothetical protein
MFGGTKVKLEKDVHDKLKKFAEAAATARSTSS